MKKNSQRNADTLQAISRWNELVSAIRTFFKEEDFQEVKTPIIVPAPIPEPHIDAIPAGKGYLRTSPEAEMKIMLAEGAERIFQIGPCFRAGETGRLHSEEFTMLEWYQTGADGMDLIPFMKKMLLKTTEAIHGTETEKILFQDHYIDFAAEWRVLSVEEAFAEFADISLETALDKNIFDETMLERIEPNLPKSEPVVLTGFPATQATLAKTDAEGKTALRWELYLGGVEIANTYTELTSPEEHSARLKAANNQRTDNGKLPYTRHGEFLAAVEKGIPESAGSALGLDRLMMVMANANSIAEIAFPVIQTM